MTIKDKFQKIIEKLFEQEIQAEETPTPETKLEEENPTPEPAPEAETKLESVSLIDGTAIDITEDVVSVIAEDGSLSPAPDGLHMLSDGSVITVASGKLTSKLSPQDVLSALASTQQLESQLSEEKLKLSEHETQLNSILEKLSKLESQPADKKIIANPVTEPEKLSKAQMRLKIARELAK
ncbi:hypothetical protein [Xanthocytophaga agilis]|uniref:Uncharacterized protein n=1 Tax=Xanthocytophaga agilis TaxID=3048010 RepID=A0AAE3UDT6_9BACT|nr:hypothetical protein [Xanthocytophaga agilis]MDJ1500671.1 hypothetical protein [Xanthocytophaga agilis]